MIVFLILAIVLVLVAVHDLLRRPVLRRVALRNLTRRMGEASLVIFGSALGTAIIAGAFIVGDTFDASIRDIARTDRGPIDELVSGLDADELDAAVSAIDSPMRIDGVDGIGTLVSIPVAITGVGDDARGEPQSRITEGDFDALRDMGADISGFADAGATPTGDELVITTELGDTLDVDAGDSVMVFAYGSSEQFTVRAVVPHVGIAGFGEAYVAPGTLQRLAEGSTLTDVEEPRAFVLISNDGGVFDSAEDSIAISLEAEHRLAAAGLDADVDATKYDLLEDAKEEGDEISEIFIVIGGFSVLAGVLLLVNLFVMLAEERKTSLGVLRAIGWRRNHLVRGFVLEGAAYAAIAGVVGAVLGIGVGWVIVQITQGIFNSTGNTFGLRLAIEPSSLITAALVGFVISMLVIWVTSVRISRLNIIRAIRDLPEPLSTRWQMLRLIVATVFVGIGIALTAILGVGGESAIPLLAGVPIALFAARTLLVRLLPERPASIAVGLAVIVWSLAVFTVFADVMEDPDISVFLLQGVLLVGGAVLITSSLGTAWAKLARMLGASGPATQLGMAYPVARRFRTGVSLAMFALIVFSLTFMAVLTSAFGQQVDTFVADTSAGFDAQVRSNAANPLDTEALAADPSIEASATLLQGWPGFQAPFDEESLVMPVDWRISGIDESFTALGRAPALTDRAAQYATDTAVFDDVITNDSVAVVSEWFLDTDEGEGVEVGDVVTLVNDANKPHALTIVGIMNEDWTFAGTFVSADLVRSHLPGEYGPVVQYVQFAEGVDHEVGVAQLSARYLSNGAEAETFDEIVGAEIQEQQGFFNLLSGYLSLGLLIGVAGLGVVMVRAVRERRRQVGMLRAMGLPTTKVRQMFLTEGAFVAVQGVLSGLVLGLLSSYQLLTQSNTFEIQLDFAVPWVVIAAIVLIPLGASALAAAIPARRAANISPAVALRLAD